LKNVTTTSYSNDFYESRHSGSLQSAALVAPIVIELLRPSSVVDVGCGTGEWLSAFVDEGVEDVMGIDGDYVDRRLLRISPERFVPADLTEPLDVGRRFDLAMSLEVAEHLPPGRGATFVADLVRLAPAVLFSAAIPYQGGVDHVNEQWLPYWMDAFSRHGYRAIDCVRPRVWSDPTVDVWYAQNTMLYVADDLVSRLPAVAELASASPSPPLSLVHPRHYEAVVSRHARQGPRELIARLPQALGASVASRLRRRRR
jgi:SAM-dependent methyltransferase